MNILIPDYDEQELSDMTQGLRQVYPGGIEPGEYEVVSLLRQHADNPEAVRFIADMLEE